MIIRVLTFVGAMAGGAGLSQFPEYSQQYQQRLSGALDEMQVVVAQFDSSLEAVGKSREEVFAQNEGSELEMRLIEDGRANVERLVFLQDAWARFKDAPVLSRLFLAPKVADLKIARKAYADFKPAVPFTVEGLACAGLGFLAAWVLFSLLFKIFAWPNRRRKAVSV